MEEIMIYQHSSFLLTDREGSSGPVKMSVAELATRTSLTVSNFNSFNIKIIRKHASITEKM